MREPEWYSVGSVIESGQQLASIETSRMDSSADAAVALNALIQRLNGKDPEIQFDWCWSAPGKSSLASLYCLCQKPEQEKQALEFIEDIQMDTLLDLHLIN